MPKPFEFTEEQIAQAKRYAAIAPPREAIDPRVEALVHELIGRVADKWTLLIIDVLAERGELRFTRIGEHVRGISQKMLTQTLRQMERDGLVVRKVFGRSAQGRIQADGSGDDLERGVLRGVGLGVREPEEGGACTPGIRQAGECKEWQVEVSQALRARRATREFCATSSARGRDCTAK
jgi:hypothetical protein